MYEFSYTIKDPVGIHARPAGLLSKEGKKYQSAITVDKDGTAVNVQNNIITVVFKLMNQ